MKHTRLSVAVLLLSFTAIAGAADPVRVETQMNTTAAFTGPGEVMTLRFEDYVSNPPPGRADPITGWVARYPTPFRGILEPDAKHTSRTPLPPKRGLLLESSTPTVAFYDNTNVADVSDPSAPIAVRFVDPRDATKAAAVSRVSLRAVGTAVSAGGARVAFFDAAGNEIGSATLKGDAPRRPHGARLDAIAYSGNREAPVIHRVELTRSEGSYLTLGASFDVEQYDFAYAGFTVLDGVAVAAPRRHIDQWSRAGDAVMFTDMSRVQPASALADYRAKGKWKVIEYETADFAGKVIAVSKESDAQTVTLKLNQRGWHAVYVGLGTVMDLVRAGSNRVGVKLSSDRTFARLSNNVKLGQRRSDMIEEVFLRTADLTGEDLQIAFSNESAVVAYVKLVPLTDEEARAVQADRATPAPKKLVATFDGHSWIWPYEPRTTEELAAMFTQFEHSDFRTWWFQVGGADLVHYPSKYGTIIGGWKGEGLEVYPRPLADRPFTESVLAMIENGVHPLQVAVDEAHRQGAEILLHVRVGGWIGSVPWEENFRSDFYEAHPEWRCIDYDGTPTMYLSYAVEAVQDHLVDVLREAMQTGADGAGVLFHRGMPMMLWEEPFVERFKSKHGVDPRTLPENDPRVHALRTEIVTQFMRKIRTMLDEEQAKRGDGKRLKIAVSTFATEADNVKFGLDVPAWAKDGLIDQVGIAWFAYHTSGLNTRKQDIAYYLRATEGTGVEVYPYLIGWRIESPDSALKDAREFYKHDVAGIVFWDPQPEKSWREAEGGYWPVISRFGRPQEIESGALNYVPTVVPMTRLGENHYSRWYPNAGF